MDMKPVAICVNLLERKRKNVEHWHDTWCLWLQKHEIPYEIVDCYHYDIISRLRNYSALLWGYANFVNADLMEAQHILDIAARMGLKVFPNHSTGWHFDDKIAEMYAFQEVQAPIPQSWVFYELEKCLEWLTKEATYPLIAKLRRGSGANNVKMLKNVRQAKYYAKRMFSKGFSPSQSLLYKTYSKVQSTRDWKTLLARIRLIPNFLIARRYGLGMPMERGYCYFQEFIENDGYDLKVVVVGNKCSYLVRKVRKGSYKASGGGGIYYDRALVTPQIINSAFLTADVLGLQCVGFDYVVNRKDGRGCIVEMCYGFDSEAISASGGYWDRSLTWHDAPLNVPHEIIKNLMENQQENKNILYTSGESWREPFVADM